MSAEIVNTFHARFDSEVPIATTPRVWPGRSTPLGASFDGSGVNFALFCEHPTKVELCLFDSPDARGDLALTAALLALLNLGTILLLVASVPLPPR